MGEKPEPERRLNKSIKPVAGPAWRRDRVSGHEPAAGHGPGWRNNKPKDMQGR